MSTLIVEYVCRGALRIGRDGLVQPLVTVSELRTALDRVQRGAAGTTTVRGVRLDESELLDLIARAEQ